MSNADSFVDEVSEELRRDRASRLLRKWGWLAIVAVVAIVAAAAWVEWRASARAADARAFGDALSAALDAPVAARADAIAAIDVDGAGRGLVRALLQAAALAEAGDDAAAAATLIAAAEEPGLDPRYGHLALTKAMLAGGTGDAARDAALLDRLAAPGAPYRPVAVELQAIAAIARGEDEVAVERLRVLTEEAGVGEGSRRRAAQLLTALGETAGAS